MTDRSGVNHPEYLIVAGTTKAATSSFYHYLQQHPDIAVTKKKECGYWLDADYSHFSKHRYASGMANDYPSLFEHKPAAKLHVDVSPDYLYSTGTLERLKKHVPQSKFLFLLREPISRLVSWYNFSRQIGFLPPENSINTYMKQMLNLKPIKGNTPQHLQALQQGKYGVYLQQYMADVSPSQLKILYYEDLIGNERNTMFGFCDWCGIDPGYYRTYDFEQMNKSTDYRNRGFHNMYHSLKLKAGMKTMQVPWLHRGFRTLRKAVEPVLMELNSKPVKQTNAISQEIREELKRYYREDVSLVNGLYPVPELWKKQYDLT
jgi:hypothetical protein